MRRRIIIIGGGFGGLSAAQELKDSNDEIIVIDKTNHHLFQPLLYQVATAALSPADIAIPIRVIFRKNRNIKVIMDEVKSIDVHQKEVILTNNKINYDILIVAPGSRHSYFGKGIWEDFAPGLKTLGDALTIREKIIESLEEAERCNNPADMNKFLTFVIVGGGPTGVELAGAIAEIAKKTMVKDYKNIKSRDTKVYLIEGQSKILSAYPDELSSTAKKYLESLGVEVILNALVTNVNENGVEITDKFIETRNVIWAAGNEASPLLKSLNVPLDKSGRVIVNDQCNIPDHPEVFVIGDAAQFKTEEGKILPGIAPVAMQQGKYVAKIIKENSEKKRGFRYKDKGNIATVGRAKAVAEIKGLKLKGFTAWFVWSFIHILYLIDFRNRFRVMAEWIWYYFTLRHGIRLIVGKNRNSY